MLRLYIVAYGSQRPGVLRSFTVSHRYVTRQKMPLLTINQRVGCMSSV